MTTDFRKLQDIIDDEIRNINIKSEPANLYQPIKYSLDSGGKRIRPVLALMAYKLFKQDIQKAIIPSIAIEIFHNFTLLHDDIMDKSEIRRGKESVFNKWNSDIALLSGDAMSIMATNLLNKAPENNKEIMETFTDAALKVCEGQQYDMDFETQSDINEDDYLNMISLKTGALLAVSPQIGALMAGANKSDADLLYDFGLNLGLAFQLQDDWMDCYANQEKFGKTIGEDIVNNKKTYLLIKAREIANPQIKSLLDSTLSDNNIDDNKKINIVRDIYNKTGVKTLLDKKVNNLFAKSEDALNKLSVEKSKKQDLYKILRYIRNRNS